MAIPLHIETYSLDTVSWTPIIVPIALGGGCAHGLVLTNSDLANAVKLRTDKNDAATEVEIGPTTERQIPPRGMPSMMPTGQRVAWLKAEAGAPDVKAWWF